MAAGGGALAEVERIRIAVRQAQQREAAAAHAARRWMDDAAGGGRGDGGVDHGAAALEHGGAGVGREAVLGPDGAARGVRWRARERERA